MKRRSHLLFYLLLNVIVSAATILLVLLIWDRARPSALETLPTPPGGAAAVAAATAKLAQPTETLPPGDAPLIEIVSVVGAGDVQQEVVMLRRLGDGNLRMTGWKLQGSHDNTYTFPDSPELILFKGGAVQIYTRTGTDTATEIYWNRDKAAWRSGETLRLLDPQGQERAKFTVP